MSLNILLTVAYLDGWHGSAIQILEYAEILSKTNQVSIACLRFTSDFKSLLQETNVNVFEVKNESMPLEYDLVYSFHFPVLSFLLNKGIKTKKWVAGSLSPTTALESFPSYWKEANFLTVHSGRSIELHNMHYGIPQDKMKLFGNPIPDYFADFKHHKDGFPKYPKKIGIVSNHTPDEILRIKKYLPKNIKLEFYGYSKKYVRITPEILSQYDLIITVGKTVNYALGMGIPVYEYDMFGGCGYITVDNYAPEKFRNFCGLATERKLDSQVIVSEILQNYEAAVCNISTLQSYALDDFLLSKLMKDFIDFVNASSEVNLSKEKLLDYSLEITHDIITTVLLAGIDTAKDKKIIDRLIGFIRRRIYNWH